RRDGRVVDAAHVGHGRTDLAGLGREDREILAVDAHRDIGLTLAEDLGDPVGRIGRDGAGEARGAIDGRLDAVQVRVVVGSRIHADPDLAGVHARALVRHDRAADVRADVANTG